MALERLALLKEALLVGVSQNKNSVFDANIIELRE